jgi:hypothetical protein
VSALPCCEAPGHGHRAALGIHATRTAGRALPEALDHGAVHGVHGEVVLGDVRGLRSDVVRDQAAPEPALAAVPEAPVDHAAVEEHDVAALHDGRDGGGRAGRARRRQGAPLLGVEARGDGLADDGQGGGAGAEDQAPVLLVAVVERQPGRDARPGGGEQVHVVLVQVLPARLRRLEVHHRLHRVRLRLQHRRENTAEARVGHVGERHRVAPVGLQQARVALQRVGVSRVHWILRVAVAAALDHRREVLSKPVALRLREQVADDPVAVAVKGGDHLRVQGRRSRRAICRVPFQKDHESNTAHIVVSPILSVQSLVSLQSHM